MLDVWLEELDEKQKAWAEDTHPAQKAQMEQTPRQHYRKEGHQSDKTGVTSGQIVKGAVGERRGAQLTSIFLPESNTQSVYHFTP